MSPSSFPYLFPWSLHLDFDKIGVWKIKLDELDFEDYTGIKNQVRKGQKLNFVQLNFSNLIYQKSSADQ